MNSSHPTQWPPSASHPFGPQAGPIRFDQDLRSWGQSIAILCYSVKQHFASKVLDTVCMAANPINEVLAANLAYFMAQRGLTQKALAEKCGVGQTTISLYLNPSRRKSGIGGKPASAKLSEVEMLAKSLDVEIWEMLRQLSDEERQAHAQIEQAFRALQPPETLISKPVQPKAAGFDYDRIIQTQAQRGRKQQ